MLVVVVVVASEGGDVIVEVGRGGDGELGGGGGEGVGGAPAGRGVRGGKGMAAVRAHDAASDAAMDSNAPPVSDLSVSLAA